MENTRRQTECDGTIILLVNFIPPPQLPLFHILASRIRGFTILLSVPMESNRAWKPQWEGLNVVLQKNITVRTVSRHPRGFQDLQFIHLPYDTFFQLSRRHPDVVISLEFGFRSLQALAYRILHPASQLIIWAPMSERTELNRGILRRFLRTVILTRSDAVFVNGRSGFRYIRRFGVPERRIYIVPYTVDTEVLSSIPLSRPMKKKRRLLYVGQLIKRKGLIPFLDILIRWMRLHPETQVEFRLLGDGILREQILGISLPENLTLSLLGNVAYSEMRQYYADSDLFVFPSLADEWGLVVNEALMAGLPVLGSIHSQAVAEMVDDGKNGWLFNPDDPQSVSQTLDSAFSAPFHVLERMRVEARISSSRFSPDLVAERILLAIHAIRKERHPDSINS
jgi:glycosyltransferase involved in cell wall biosynthesis